MRRIPARLITLATLALAASAFAVNCSKHSSDPGSLQLALTVPGGFTIQTVNYTVSTATNPTVAVGMFSVSDPNAAVALDLALPPGHYDIALTAHTAAPDHPFSGTTAPTGFNVTSGQTTNVSLILVDAAVTPGPATGTAIVKATVVPNDHAPVIDSVVVAPAQTSTNSAIDVRVVAHDIDVGDTLTYAWTATPDGAFASAGAAITTYSSASGGPKTLTITVTDSRSSSVAVALPVTIIGASSGTGGAGTGGAGTGGAGTGGAGTGGAGTGGAGTGGAGTGGAGTGGAGTGGAGTGGAGTGGAGTGGAGTGGAGTGGAGTGGSGLACAPGVGADECVSSDCAQCTSDNCVPFTINGCSLITDPGDKALCQAAYACFRDNAAACVSNGDPLKCWCGTNQVTCNTSNTPPTQANGVCLAQVMAAAKTTDAGTIKLRFVDPNFPLGRAVNMTLCRGSFCSAGSAPDGVSSACPPF